MVTIPPGTPQGKFGRSDPEWSIFPSVPFQLSQGCTCLNSWTSQLRISPANQSSLLKLNDWSKIMNSPIVVAFFLFFIYFYFILIYIFVLYMAEVSEIE